MNVPDLKGELTPAQRVQIAQAYMRADKARAAIVNPAFDLLQAAEAPEARVECADFAIEEVARAAVTYTEIVAKCLESVDTEMRALARGGGPGR